MAVETVEDYAAAQAAISAALVANVLRIAGLFKAPKLSPLDWRRLLKLLFPFVQEARERSAALGREFYDAQRELHFPDLPQHDSFLAEYKLDWFEEAMTPSRQAFLEPGASDNELSELALRAMKEVENGGRRQILKTVNEDKVVQGWARVATGRETCEFCLTMISRGPVYRSARGAGLRTNNTDAQKLWARGDDKAMNELMKRWHPGCDCKVVPVFDKTDWPGMEEADKALEVWKKYSKLVAKDPKLKKPQNGNQRGKSFKWTGNQAIMAAIRRGLYSGEIDIRDFGVSTRDWRSAA
jgi:hypothetical protein